MCKVFMVPGVKKQHVEKAWALTEKMAPIMSRTDSDGFGYAAITAEGELFGERWLKNHDAFKADVMSPGDKALVENLGEDIVEVTNNANSFGDVVRANAVAIIAHARKATCSVSMENTHPFVDGGAALIHNGVISNHTEILHGKSRLSSCDSEAILNEYLDYNVMNEPDQIDEVVQSLTGWYAAGVLTMGSMDNGEAMPILDIFKETRADLYAMYVNELETFVFSTSKIALQEALKDLTWKENNIFKIKNDFFIRLNAVTGERIFSKGIRKVYNIPSRAATANHGNSAVHGPVANELPEYSDNENWLELLENEEKERIAAAKDLRSVN